MEEARAYATRHVLAAFVVAFSAPGRAEQSRSEYAEGICTTATVDAYSLLFFLPIIVSVDCPTGPHPPLRLARPPDRGHMCSRLTRRALDADQPDVDAALVNIILKTRGGRSWEEIARARFALPRFRVALSVTLDGDVEDATRYDMLTCSLDHSLV